MILKTTRSLSSKRKNLTCCDKIRVLHYLKTIPNLTTVGRLFGVTRFVIARIRYHKSRILDEDARGVPSYVRRPIKHRYFKIDSEDVQFVEFARSLRLPVTCSISEERALIAAE